MPFQSVRTLSGGAKGLYVVGALFTDAYAAKAERLAASCEKFGLQYAIHQVPSVHRATSARGTGDLAYTKANVIRSLLAAHKKPVLYVDADCEFVSPPSLVDQLVRSGRDFAIYNWLADDYTDKFRPIELSPSPGEPPVANRFYRFSGSVDWVSDSQLLCSGCVQFYANSFAARALLKRWHQTVATFPNSADDMAMDFTFNNIMRRSWLRWLLKAQWLPRSYARYAWWIQCEPVVNHPDFPAPTSDFALIKDPKGRQIYYRSQMKRQSMVAGPLPRDGIIDTERHLICRLSDGILVPVGPTDQTFWL